MKINLPNRQVLLIKIAAAGVGLLILNSVVISPLGDLWSDHSAEITRLKASVAEGRGLIARGPSLRRHWAEMQAGALPRDPAQSEHDVISNFESWSRSTGVELGSVKPNWRHGANEDYSLLECRLDATGTLSALSRFLYEVERSPLALRVESDELLSRDDSGQRLTLSLIITGLRLSPLEAKQP
jgi:hypothetical protein